MDNSSIHAFGVWNSGGTVVGQWWDSGGTVSQSFRGHEPNPLHPGSVLLHRLCIRACGFGLLRRCSVNFSTHHAAKSGSDGSGFAEGSVSVGQAISDTIAGFKEISVHSQIPYFLDRISEARARTARACALQAYIQATPRLVAELALIVSVSARLKVGQFRSFKSRPLFFSYCVLFSGFSLGRVSRFRSLVR